MRLNQGQICIELENVLCQISLLNLNDVLIPTDQESGGKLDKPIQALEAGGRRRGQEAVSHCQVRMMNIALKMCLKVPIS